MAIASNASLVDALGQHRLLEPAQLAEANSLQARFPEPKALAGELIRRGWLTTYQADQILQGSSQELLLGSYVLLEKLGEGGMGQVFKARNWKLGRVVALKLIRKQRLDNPDAVRRFEREVRSAAALSHPNIVHAHDADRVGGTHLLVMEYIEGTDLARLVKKHGPLPAERACEFTRQVALGLQHAHERGLVHRDIKPHNLLLTADGKTIKILDMGLARLDQPEAEEEVSSTMTQEGVVMGTADYMAPEQATDSHTVDIRADLYSLGCTFYYLLTGSVPFPGGTSLQKLHHHQFEEPTPITALRPDIPPAVSSVVCKLLAKKSEDRYQTPAEVAVALSSAVNSGGGDERTFAEDHRGVTVSEPSGDTLASPFAHLARHSAEGVDSPHRLRRTEERRRLLVNVAGGSLVVVGMIAVLLFQLLKQAARQKAPADEKDRPDVAVAPTKKTPTKADDAWIKSVAALAAGKQIEAVAAKLKELNPGFDGKVTHKIEGGAVTGLGVCTDNVTDLSPVRALVSLKQLTCNPSDWTKKPGRLADISPLEGMPLTSLSMAYNNISSLAPLKGMPLTYLVCGHNPVSDLSALRGMKLTYLHCGFSQVSDLSALKGMPLNALECHVCQVRELLPLKGMPLTLLYCHGTAVFDLSPLADLKLEKLWCYGTKVTDLSPLKGTPLKSLLCDFNPKRDAESLRPIKTLETINGRPAKDIWKEVETQQAAFEVWCKQVAGMSAEKQVEAVAAKLKEVNAGFDGKVTHKIEGGVVTDLMFFSDSVTDLAPVRALAGLHKLDLPEAGIGRSKLSDLAPLKTLRLSKLGFSGQFIVDMSPLKEMPLTELYVYDTKLSDLTPLKGLRLERLDWVGTPLSDLSPVTGMPLKEIRCAFKSAGAAEILCSIKTLETINEKPVKQFWKEVDEKKP